MALRKHNRAAALLLLALLSSACATTGWRPPNRTEQILIGVSVLLVEADTAQTIHARMTLPNFRERNPLLGSHPSPARILLQNGVAGGLLTAGLGYALPSPWRSVFLGVVIGTESAVIVTNFTGLPF